MGWAFPHRIITISPGKELPDKLFLFDKLENLNAYLDSTADSNALANPGIDSIETFLILNSGPGSMKLSSQAGSLIAIQEAYAFDNLWRPIEYWNYNWCGIDYGELKLLPRQGIIFFVSKKYGRKAGKIRIRLRTGSNGVVISAPFDGFIDDDHFILNSSLKKFGHVLKDELNFLEQ